VGYCALLSCRSRSAAYYLHHSHEGASMHLWNVCPGDSGSKYLWNVSNSTRLHGGVCQKAITNLHIRRRKNLKSHYHSYCQRNKERWSSGLECHVDK
jgi:hypothetical protein